MDDLLSRLKAAKTDNAVLNRLINDYMPFLKKEISKAPAFQMEFEDRLSIAMLVFVNCVRQYDENAGAFIPFASACIRNRLIDEAQKLSRKNERIIPLYTAEDRESAVLTDIAVQKYEKEQERSSLAEEIDSLSCALEAYHITLDELAKVCPRQSRSRRQCVRLAKEIISDKDLKEHFFKTHRVPQSALAKRFGISEKTIEKHRKYIVTITLILSDHYPGIQPFLPKGGV